MSLLEDDLGNVGLLLRGNHQTKTILPVRPQLLMLQKRDWYTSQIGWHEVISLHTKKKYYK